MMAGIADGQGNESWPDQGYEESRFEVRDPISSTFHCAICMKVLNNPMMCQNNQHSFCKGCITKHLENKHNCPTCQEELTVDTLVPARMVGEYLSELKIRCDFFDRGCRDVVQLNGLAGHVATCGFAPINCSNDRCDMVVNRQDKLHHETEVCEFRRLQCHDCVQLKNEMGNMNEKMTKDFSKLQKQIDENSKLQKQVDDQSRKLQKQVDEMGEKLSRMCEMQMEIMEKVSQMTVEMKHQNQMTLDQQLVARKSIIVMGGESAQENMSNSVETFSWTERTWTVQNAMSTHRSRAAAVVYQREVVIAGGETNTLDGTNTVETSSCGEPMQWKILHMKLPVSCRGHAAVMYNESLIFGGGESPRSIEGIRNTIYKVSMVPPRTATILTRMPEGRYDHTMELFQDKLFIFGGFKGRAKDTVLMYDMILETWKTMASLPFAVDEIASVLWQNNAIIVGGRINNDASDKVVMYNLTTGVSQHLPCMKYRRQGCTAVVTGDVLVVMGGLDKRKRLKSVEVFSFQHQVWEELPEMNEARVYARAVVKPH